MINVDVLSNPKFANLKYHLDVANQKDPSSPLNNLKQVVSDKLILIKDKVAGAYNLGAHFGDMGGRVVKDNNVTIRPSVIDGKKYTEVDFKVTSVQRDETQQMINQLWGYPKHELNKFLKHAGFNDGTVTLEHSQFEYLGVSGGEYHKNQKLDMGGAYKISIKGVGEIVIGSDPTWASIYNRVIVRLEGDKETKDLKRMLALLGLEKALDKSTKDDIERTKIGLLYEAYHPKKATELQKNKIFYNLPIEQLKQKIIADTPEMQVRFLTQLKTMKAEEILPGRLRYTVPELAKQAQSFGAVALLAGVGSQSNPQQAYERAASMLKNGALSSEQRFASGMIQAAGASSQYDHAKGGAESVFTRLITQKACDEKRDISDLPFSGEVQFVYSLNLLNRVTYQYNWDEYGIQKGSTYENRPSLLEFVKEENNSFKNSNEVMIKDAISPDMMVGCIVKSDSAKKKFISVLESSGVIKTNSVGLKVINNVPVDQFIQVGTKLNNNLFTKAVAA